MFGASVSKWKSHLRTSLFLRCYNHYPGGGNPRSFTILPGSKRSSLFKCVKSIPIGVFWIRPWFEGFGHSVANHQLICTQASSSRSTNDEVLDQILSEKKNSSESCVKICEAQIDRLCSGGDLRTAAWLMQSLRDKEIDLSLRTYNRLLEAAAEQGDFDILSQSFKCLLVSSNSVHPKSFLIIANAFEKKNDDAFLLKFVKEVSELASSRIVTIMNQMIYAFGDCREVDKALLIFEHLKALKCEPDLVTYNTILLLLGRCGRIDDMLDQFSSMKKVYIVPDTVSYNTILNSLRKVGRLDLCLAISEEMREQGVEPDLRTYTDLIDILGKLGNTEEAIRLFDEMKQKNIRPSIYVYRSLIQRLKKMGKLKLAVQFSEEMNRDQSNLVGPKDFKKKKR